MTNMYHRIGWNLFHLSDTFHNLTTNCVFLIGSDDLSHIHVKSLDELKMEKDSQNQEKEKGISDKGPTKKTRKEQKIYQPPIKTGKCY